MPKKLTPEERDARNQRDKDRRAARAREKYKQIVQSERERLLSLSENERVEEENRWLLDLARSGIKSTRLRKRYDLDSLIYYPEDNVYSIELKCKCGGRRKVFFLSPIAGAGSMEPESEHFGPGPEIESDGPIRSSDSENDSSWDEKVYDGLRSLHKGKGRRPKTGNPVIEERRGVEAWLQAEWHRRTSGLGSPPVSIPRFPRWSDPLREIDSCEECFMKVHPQIVPRSVRWEFSLDGANFDTCEYRCPKCSFSGYTIPIEWIHEFEDDGLLPPATCPACIYNDYYEMSVLEMIHGEGWRRELVLLADCKKCGQTTAFRSIEEIVLCPECTKVSKTITKTEPPKPLKQKSNPYWWVPLEGTKMLLHRKHTSVPVFVMPIDNSGHRIAYRIDGFDPKSVYIHQAVMHFDKDNDSVSDSLNFPTVLKKKKRKRI